MFDNINVWMIVRDHLKTLKYYREDRTSAEDVTLFLIIPILASLAIVLLLDYRLNVDAINALITSLSVFSGLLFNLLLLIYELLRKEDTEKETSDVRVTFLSHIHAHISFTILTAVLTITLLLFLFIEIHLPPLTAAVNVAVIFLIINFVFTLLMILQRVHILISESIPPVNTQK